MKPSHREADRLRQLIACENFCGAAAAVLVYGQELRTELDDASSASARTLLQKALTTLEDARRKVIAARSGLLHELRSLPRTTAYSPHTSSARIHTWNIEA